MISNLVHNLQVFRLYRDIINGYAKGDANYHPIESSLE